MKYTRQLLIAIATVVAVGCDRTQALPRHAGVVFAHVGSADSKTGTSSELAETGQCSTGFDYGDASAIDWDATINWKYLTTNDAADCYRLNWDFSPSSGAPESGVSDVSYDGSTQAVAVINDQLTVTIGPSADQDGG